MHFVSSSRHSEPWNRNYACLLSHFNYQLPGLTSERKIHSRFVGETTQNAMPLQKMGMCYHNDSECPLVNEITISKEYIGLSDLWISCEWSVTWHRELKTPTISKKWKTFTLSVEYGIYLNSSLSVLVDFYVVATVMFKILNNVQLLHNQVWHIIMPYCLEPYLLEASLNMCSSLMQVWEWSPHNTGTL